MGKLLFIVLSLASIVVSGVIFSVMWGWFIVPLGVMPLSVAHAIGIQAIIAFLVLRVEDEYKSIEDHFVDLITSWVTKWGIVFGIAWIAHLNM